MKSTRAKINPISAYTILFLVLLIFGNCSRSDNYPKNIIIYIGDGMGVAHITAGKIALGRLNLDRFAVTGMVTTHSENELITESAAAATALATGHTASMVPIFAYGPGSRNFNGIQDNTRVGQTLIDLLLKKEIKN
jgi:alkaline phosphatase